MPDRWNYSDSDYQKALEAAVKWDNGKMTATQLRRIIARELPEVNLNAIARAVRETIY